jgi:CRP-like cAMP-binding protein
MHENRLDIPLILSRLPLFQKLAPEQLAALESACRERRLSKGRCWCTKAIRQRVFLSSSSARSSLAFPSSQGNEKVVEILGPHQSFGEAVMFMDLPYPVLAEGWRKACCCISPAHRYSSSSNATPCSPGACWPDSRCACIPWFRTWKPTRCVPRHNAWSATCCSIARKAACEGSFDISLPTSKQVIASRLNLTPETLSRIFHDLSANGLIAVSGKQITVINDAKRCANLISEGLVAPQRNGSDSSPARRRRRRNSSGQDAPARAAIRPPAARQSPADAGATGRSSRRRESSSACSARRRSAPPGAADAAS